MKLQYPRFLAVLQILLISIPACLISAHASLMYMPGSINDNATVSPESKFLTQGIAALKKGDFKQAEKAFKDAMAANSSSAVPLLGLVQVEMQQNHPQKAKAWLQKAESLSPSASEIQVAWGRYYVTLKDYESAASHYNKALAMAPGAIVPLLEVSDFYSNIKKDYPAAVKYYRRAVKMSPNNPKTHYGLAVALAASNQREKAIKEFLQTAKLVPADPLPLQSLGRLYLSLGNTDKALDSFAKALKRNPDFIPAHLDRGNIYFKYGDIKKAIIEYDSAVKSDSSNISALLKLGTMLLLDKQWQRAETIFQRVISIDSTIAAAYNNLAWIGVSQHNKLDLALKHAKTAVKLEPDSADYLDTLASVYNAQGKYKQAIPILEKAISINPNMPEIHYHLGISRQNLGMSKQAAEAFNAALKLNPDFENSKDAKKRLDDL
ncbi:MAG: tetratricopeptide repeat protein [Gammaproteobacteria bacterium]|jgi:tetratricopeptide (TPR) repeat protein